MRNTALAVAALFVVSCHPQNQNIAPGEAKNYVDKKVTVCGMVYGVYIPKKDGVPTFLHFGGNYPNQVFSVVIFKDDAGKFTYPVTSLANKNVCVTGYVKIYKGKPEMTVNSPSQIVVK